MAGLVCALGGLVASPARADDFLDFEHAHEAYQARDYAEAVRRFEALVGGEVPRLSDPVYINESRKFLAAAYVWEDRREDAERQFELLLRAEPGYVVDSADFPNAVVTLYRSVRRRVEQQMREEAEQRRLEEERRRQQELDRLMRNRARIARLEELAASETVVEEGNRALAFIPFGVGQFVNGDDGLGYLFAITEGILFVGSFVSFFVWDSIDAANYPEDPSNPALANERFAADEEAWRVTNWSVAGALLVTAIIGIIEAQIRYEPTIRSVRRRQLPPELEDLDDPTPESELDLQARGPQLDFSLSPTGAGFSLAF